MATRESISDKILTFINEQPGKIKERVSHLDVWDVVFFATYGLGSAMQLSKDPRVRVAGDVVCHAVAHLSPSKEDPKQLANTSKPEQTVDDVTLQLRIQALQQELSHLDTEYDTERYAEIEAEIENLLNKFV